LAIKKKKNSINNKKEMHHHDIVGSIIHLLSSIVVPNILEGLKKRIEYEVDLITSRLESKFDDMKKRFISHLIQAGILLIAVLFISLGLIFFLMDVLNIGRSYLFLGLGIILLLVILFNQRIEHDKK